ncbi:PREDICTED: uncharacterized protein LOC108505069 [Lepidothrix coronata]|uniref:Uncharacterized protein LOC108505069 n=1 Tax=Lepidothrix coronata TaxID=321398 RepID=A0A6J0IJT5_9PASS|nr:PREDICTED: uncharacterized protein LOC108505069 [Lepidothrix coronata]
MPSGSAFPAAPTERREMAAPAAAAAPPAPALPFPSRGCGGEDGERARRAGEAGKERKWPPLVGREGGPSAHLRERGCAWRSVWGKRPAGGKYKAADQGFHQQRKGWCREPSISRFSATERQGQLLNHRQPAGFSAFEGPSWFCHFLKTQFTDEKFQVQLGKSRGCWGKQLIQFTCSLICCIWNIRKRSPTKAALCFPGNEHAGGSGVLSSPAPPVCSLPVHCQSKRPGVQLPLHLRLTLTLLSHYSELLDRMPANRMPEGKDSVRSGVREIKL